MLAVASVALAVHETERSTGRTLLRSATETFRCVATSGLLAANRSL